MMSMVVPVIMLGVMVWGIACRVDVWSTLVEGGAQGLQTAVRMVPSLVGLLCGVYMLRASGALELLEGPGDRDLFRFYLRAWGERSLVMQMARFSVPVNSILVLSRRYTSFRIGDMSSLSFK